MNNASQCIFDITHVLKHMRDTMEYAIPKEHDMENYNQRKRVLTSLNDPKSFLGKFLVDNADKLVEFKKKYDDFLEEIYGDNSSILTKTSEGKIRVDNTQNQKILDYVTYLSETLRDILYSHIQFATGQNAYEPIVSNLVLIDEKFDRIVKSFLLLQEYNKHFMEFQKVMSESQGKPTPQSNYIVQNELNPIGNMIKFVRDHAHCTDNRTLDILDKAVQLMQMCEGRRDRRDGKNFGVLFKEVLDEYNGYVSELGPQVQVAYDAALKEMLDAIKANADKNASGDAANKA